MSSWFKDRRQEFITATFKQFGQVRRADICSEFQVSQQLASTDIDEWRAANVDKCFYDVTAKRYILKED